MAASTHDGGLEKALFLLKSTEPPLYLSASPELSQSARSASEYLFSLLKPFTPKSPFSSLLTQGFDAEQIWQQIDLQTQPLISNLRREINNFEKNPEQIGKLFNFERKEGLELGIEKESEGLDNYEELEGGMDDDDDDDDDDEEEEEEEEEEERENEEEGGDGVEDKFLKINELEEYLEDDEAREYGFESNKKKKGNKKVDDEDVEDDEDEEDDDEVGIFL